MRLLSPRETRPPFVCAACGARRVSFHARCAECGRWNTYHRADRQPGAAARGPAGAVNLGSPDAAPPRLQTGIPWLDRLLGGGFVAGCSVLLYGAPGSGKSTLAAQAAWWAAARAKRPALYVSGEEGLVQVRERVLRLGLNPAWLYFNHPAELTTVQRDLLAIKPSLLVLDSVQKLDLAGAGGEQTRVRRAFVALLALLRELRVPGLLLSQVNAAGAPSGGRIFTHDPDVVLALAEFDGKRSLCVEKNRFGPVAAASLSMTAAGLEA